MKPLGFPDSHYLSAAHGWLELGLVPEAEAELERLAPAHRQHPEVLRLLCRVAWENQRWRQCAEAARSLAQAAPEDSTGWVYLAHSLHQLGRTAEAYQLLSQVQDIAKPDPGMALGLSCLACCLGHWEESQDWLARAFELAAQPHEREQLKERALVEPALAPLRDIIQHLA
jgi:uncharacterized protein HemY